MLRAACSLLALGSAACGGASAAPAPPTAPAPTCAATAAHVKQLARGDAERAARVALAFEERCTSDGWPDAVRACIVSTASLDKPKRCKEQLSTLQRSALERAIEEAAYVAPAGPCEAYFALARRVERCTPMPKGQRAAYQVAIESVREQYTSTASADYKDSLAESCRYGAESLTDTLDRVCP